LAAAERLVDPGQGDRRRRSAYDARSLAGAGTR
jgi:hypothetical protein